LSTTFFIALINPAIALIFSATFFLLWRHQRHRRYIATIGFALLSFAIAFLFQYFTTPLGLGITKLLSNMLFVVGAILLIAGCLGRYGRKPPLVPIMTVAVAGLSVLIWYLYIDPDLTWRIYAINFTFGTMTLLLAVELRTVPNRRLIDNLLLGAVIFWGVQFFPRPLIVSWVEGPYLNYDGFYDSLYWITLTFSASLFLLVSALIMVTAIALDVIEELKSQSETDPLSGLLNRRGFEERIAGLMANAAERGVPLALVVIDLDRFKQVNDSFGHGAGDNVIIGFARMLRNAGEGRHLAGRIGGEEFAVVLEHADVTAARLFAESIRVAFSTMSIDGLPADRRCTASFGVAQMVPGEKTDDLFRRADQALYTAKRTGRDCVRVSPSNPANAVAWQVSGAAG